MNPVPTIPSECARRDCPLNQCAARAAEAAVRAAEMIEPSSMAKGIPGFVVIEHEHGRSTRKAALDAGRITGDPLQPGHAEVVSEVGRERDDPAIGLVGEL